MDVNGTRDDIKKAETEVKNLPENVGRDEIALKKDDARVLEANGDPIKKVEEDDEKAKTANVSLPISDSSNNKENTIENGKENVKESEKECLSNENGKENSKESEKECLSNDNGNEIVTKNVKESENECLPKENGNEIVTKNVKESEKECLSNENGNEIVTKNVKESEKECLSSENGKENVKEIEKESLSNENGNEIVTKSEKGESSSSASSSPTNAKTEESLISDENAFVADLKEYEKKALMDLKSKLEEAILMNKLFKKSKNNDDDKIQESHKEESEKIADANDKQDNVDKGKDKIIEVEKDENTYEVDKDISLWGVPLLPSKGDSSTDILLFKFLLARDFKPNDALEMLRNTLEWRKENKIDSITEEELSESFYDSVGYMKGSDREGHPVCYNVYGVFADEAMYNQTFGTEANREKFLRWRLQLLEREIRKLDFRPGGVSKLLQINDLKNTPGPSRRDLRHATKRAVGILQDNYPEFVSRNIFINVPFWYYAFNAILSPFLTPRTKNKFVFSRPSRVTETLLKYIAVEEIPMIYGGLRREDDPDFSTQDPAFEVNVKAGATETVEIPAPEVGNSLMWDLTIVGWDVSYKEEFVPTDEGSYTMIVKKQRKISWQQESIRNTFANKEPGKLVITIENSIFKKKRVLYRYKIKNNSASSSSSSS